MIKFSNKKSFFMVLVILIIILLIIVFFFNLFFIKPIPKTDEERLLESFVNTNLADEYVPEPLNVIKKLTGDGKTDGFDYMYGAIWYKDNKKFYANLHYNDNTSKQISNFHMFIITDEIPITIDEEISNLLFIKYFKNELKGTTKCIVLNYTIGYFCENFGTEENGNKKGTVLISVMINNETNKFLGMCEFPVGGKDHESNSCVQW